MKDYNAHVKAAIVVAKNKVAQLAQENLDQNYQASSSPFAKDGGWEDNGMAMAAEFNRIIAILDNINPNFKQYEQP